MNIVEAFLSAEQANRSSAEQVPRAQALGLNVFLCVSSPEFSQVSAATAQIMIPII